MEELDLIKVGQFITKLRKEKNWTQQQLAEKMIVSHKTVSKWENGNGFPDYSYQKELCNIFNITIEELHNGQLDVAKRRKTKINKILLRFAICSYILLVPILLSLLIFFLTTYKSLKIYSLMNEHTQKQNVLAKGIFMDSKSMKLIYIGSIAFLNSKVTEEDIINVDIYSNEKLIYHSNVYDNILAVFEKYVDVNPDNIYLKIDIRNTEGSQDQYDIKLIADDAIVNHKMDYVTSDYDLLYEEKIIKKIEAEGFQKIDNDAWKKIITDSKESKTITINPELLRLHFIASSKDIYKHINYYHDKYQLETYIYYKNDNLHTLVEKYIYNYENKTINCQVGLCTTKDEVLKMMEKYINLLNVE